jgi:hypothetical protein
MCRSSRSGGAVSKRQSLLLGLDHIHRKILIHGGFREKQTSSNPDMPDFLLGNEVPDASNRPSGSVCELFGGQELRLHWKFTSN